MQYRYMHASLTLSSSVALKRPQMATERWIDGAVRRILAAHASSATSSVSSPIRPTTCDSEGYDDDSPVVIPPPVPRANHRSLLGRSQRAERVHEESKRIVARLTHGGRAIALQRVAMQRKYDAAFHRMAADRGQPPSTDAVLETAAWRPTFSLPPCMLTRLRRTRATASGLVSVCRTATTRIGATWLVRAWVAIWVRVV